MEERGQENNGFSCERAELMNMLNLITLSRHIGMELREF